MCLFLPDCVFYLCVCRRTDAVSRAEGRPRTKSQQTPEDQPELAAPVNTLLCKHCKLCYLYISCIFWEVVTVELFFPFCYRGKIYFLNLVKKIFSSFIFFLLLLLFPVTALVTQDEPKHNIMNVHVCVAECACVKRVTVAWSRCISNTKHFCAVFVLKCVVGVWRCVDDRAACCLLPLSRTDPLKSAGLVACWNHGLLL